jgi:hypothetical protein
VRLEEVGIKGGTLHATVRIENATGHKLPTAYPSRRAWIRFSVLDGDGTPVFESGRLKADGSIAGNDNDRDPDRYEPHRRVIDDPEQVQIYEAIMADPDGNVTTGLITAIRYVKDSRLPPHGFDKTTAGNDIAVQGAAMDDPDFTSGGDATRYEADVSGARGPFTVRAELMYQPVAFRWAHNLAGYDAAEPQRFVRMYEQLSDRSAILLAAGEAAVD